MLTTQRRVVDQQKGYYVGLITFFSLLIVLVVAISELIKYVLIKREGLSREKIGSAKLKFCLKLYLKSLTLRFKNRVFGRLLLKVVKIVLVETIELQSCEQSNKLTNLDVMTSDLPPRLAWGVGRLTKPQRSRGGFVA
jgi:hypothetical protein